MQKPLELKKEDRVAIFFLFSKAVHFDEAVELL